MDVLESLADAATSSNSLFWQQSEVALEVGFGTWKRDAICQTEFPIFFSSQMSAVGCDCFVDSFCPDLSLCICYCIPNSHEGFASKAIHL